MRAFATILLLTFITACSQQTEPEVGSTSKRNIAAKTTSRIHRLNHRKTSHSVDAKVNGVLWYRRLVVDQS